MPTVSVQQAFDLALQHHQAGRLAEAEAIYRQILTAEPGHVEPLHLLGVIASQVGRNDVAVDLIGRAIAARPDYPEAHSNLGNALKDSGRLDEATTAYRHAISLKPNYPEAHYNLGIALYEKRRLGEAMVAFRQAIAFKPNYPEAHNNLGGALKDNGQLDEAITAYRQAIALNPDWPEAHNNLGVALCEKGQLDEATVEFRRAIELKPNYPEAHNNLGIGLQGRGRLDEAIACFRQAIALKPDFPEAHSDLGNALKDHGQPDEAIAACRQAIALKPNLSEAHNNLGNALKDKGQLDEAIIAYRQAIALKPGLREAHNNLGVALIENGRLDEAIAAFRRVLELRPDFAAAYNNLGIALKNQGQFEEATAAYRRSLELKPDFAVAHSNLIFLLDLLESKNVAQQQKERHRWYEQHGRRFERHIRSHDNDRDPERRLRIGYVSADFRRHSACYVFAPVVCGHDQNQFEVFCYSGANREDDATARLRQAADAWRSTLGVWDEALAEHIRRDRIDILVDLSGHTSGNRLLAFARKPAPVQVTAWGHATGTGMKTMDFFFADSVVVPSQERALYAEEVMDLPCVLCYEPPEYLPEVSVLPASQGSPVTYGCVNRLEKIADRMIALWGRILEGVPGARLLVKDKGFNDAAFRQQFLHRLHTVGRIQPGRVLLPGSSPHAEHLKVFHQIDVGLDPFPQGGGVSTFEALWMGVPVVTLLGATVPSRLTASVLSLIEMQDWVAQTDDDYIRIALEAGRDLERIAKLRQALRERLRSSPFGDVKGYTRAVEEAYRQMWRKWCAKQSPPRS